MKSIAVAFAVVLASFAAVGADAASADQLVDVVSRNVAWTCRRTAEGCVLDFTNRIGTIKVKGKPDITDPGKIGHVSVFYKPTGKTYTFDLAPTSTLSVAFGAKMPDFPERFSDTNLYAAVDIPAPFDLGVTASRPSQRVVSNRWNEKFLIKTVPCEKFTRAFVLCAVDERKGGENAFVVRITRWADSAARNFSGRARHGMAETFVDFDKAKKTRAGEVMLGGRRATLWMVEAPLDLGDIQDVVDTDKNGNFIRELGRYLDFELMGPLKTHRAAMGDTTMDTDPTRRSSVTVFGARLERPAAEFAMHWTEPGNIFHNDEVPETFADVKVNKPGKYVLSWLIGDAEGHTVGEGSRECRESLTEKVSLAMKTPGWYSLKWRLSDAEDRTLMTHSASFALLGKDTRTSGFGEGPYGVGSTFSWHYRIPDERYQDGAKLIMKYGARHGDMPKYNRYNLTVEERRRWKHGKSMFSHLDRDYRPVFAGTKTEDQLAEELRKRREDDPNTVLCQLFWESYPKCYRQAPEITGGKYDPSTVDKGMTNRLALAMKSAAFMRKYFPDIKITIGNTLACTELVAELMRNGFPEEYADYIGLEVVGRDNLPERQWNASLQSADLFRELIRLFGYEKWKPGSGVENNYRIDTVLGADRQAWWYVRDLVLGQCWRFPHIHVGDLVDAGNQYAASPWGECGMCKRWPFLYPKKAYVGMATATKMLDMVTDVKFLPTGDDCAYAVEFSRRDGKKVCCMWTSRGIAEFSFATRGDFKIVDFYGRDMEPRRSGDRTTLSAREAMTYVVSAESCVYDVKCVARSYPDDAVPNDFRVAVKADDASKWRIADGDYADIARGLGHSVPCRIRAGAASISTVDDPEVGRCLEIDLGAPDLSLPKPVMEYVVAELKNPVAIEGRPRSAGMRVKGNSGWGRLYWILEGADGVRTCSSGAVQWSDDFDYNGRMTVCYAGWGFMRYPLVEKSPITDYSTFTVAGLWSRGCVKYPAKLVGIAFAAESRPLFLTERRKKEQKVRIAEIGFFD